MRRREFMMLLGGAVTWPSAARAQQPERMRVGALMAYAANDPPVQQRNAASLQRLQQMGERQERAANRRRSPPIQITVKRQ
jgi:putative tryptophan/tyrosine transport system substrate-binding protein